MAQKGKDPNDMSFFEHLDAMRPGLIRSFIAIAILFVAAFAFSDQIMEIVMGPQSPDFPTNALFRRWADAGGGEVLRINSRPLTLINTAMAGQFNLHMLISLYTSLILLAPYLLFEIWLFVSPALSERERKGIYSVMGYIVVSMIAGLLFGYFILAPISVNFLANYSVGADIQNLIEVSSYMHIVLNMSLVCALIFELPVMSHFLSRIGILSSNLMRRYRRHAIVALAVFSAIITPPDIMSMILVAIPLYMLYEVSIVVVSRNEKRRRKQN